MNKIVTLHTRVTQAEATALKMIARHELRKPSEALREILREAALKRGLWAQAIELSQNEQEADNER